MMLSLISVTSKLNFELLEGSIRCIITEKTEHLSWNKSELIGNRELHPEMNYVSTRAHHQIRALVH